MPDVWTTLGDRAVGADRGEVYRRVLEAIRSGRLAPGTPLPSARRLAAAWGVTRRRVDQALGQLQAEGLVERRVGHGTRVVEHLRAAARVEPDAPQAPHDAAVDDVLHRLAGLAGPAAEGDHGPGLLRPFVPDTRALALAPWRRALARGLAEDRRSMLSYGEPAGLPALRAAAARHLSLTRSLACSAEQVIIVAGPLHALELVAQVLLEPGDRVCVDDPGFVGAARLLDLAHLRVTGVPLDAEGFDVDFARRHAPEAAAVVVQPLNQVPTGCRTSAARKRALLDWAGSAGPWIVELDLAGEIVHDGAAPPPLAALDRQARVIHVSSFEPLTFPTLRLGCLVLPEALVDVFAAVRGLMGDHAPVAMQAALAGWIDEGHLSAHLRVVRPLYRQRRDVLAAALRRHLPQAVPGPLDGGLHACLGLPAGPADAPLAAALQARGVRARALSALAWQAPGLNGLVIGAAADEPAAIEDGVRRIAACCGG